MVLKFNDAHFITRISFRFPDIFRKGTRLVFGGRGITVYLWRRDMMKKWVFLMTAVFSAALFCAGEVTVTEKKMEILTYMVGPDDPNPPLWKENVYPYPMETDITREKTMVEYRVVILENEYIKVLILPDLGGRIYAAFDKTNNNFDFIYHNRVIKPGLVALRGAWISGGIEWNFPTRGHTVNTFSPVKVKIFKNSGGGATCVVGTEEWVRRMKWQVFITVLPGRSYFKTKVRLFNRTESHHLAYFWANAAVHAWDDTRVFSPPTDYTYAGRRRNPTPWPVYKGKDRSWYRATSYPHDYFCGVPGDFNGSYNILKDSGTVHYAFRYDSPGKKYWTWGTAPSGTIWEDILTDDDGAYIEIQGGRLLTQGDSWIFEPHLVEKWEEFWYPVKNMGGVVKANSEAAVNLEVDETGILAALNTTGTYENAEVRLERGEATLLVEKVTLSPADSYRRNIPHEWEAGPYTLRFLNREGEEVISYTSEKPAVPEPELQPDFSDVPSETAQVDFLKGYYAMKHWDREGAVYHFIRCLRKNPDYYPAKKWLGLLYFHTGLTEEALRLFEEALDIFEDDLMARYYRALCKMRLGIKERTEEDLHMLGRRAAYRHVSPYLLAAEKLAEKDYSGAAALLEQCLRFNPEDVKAEVLLAAATRLSGNEKGARERLAGALKKDPLSALALIENERLNGKSPWNVLADDQYALEAACDYMKMNLNLEAAACLESRISGGKGSRHPLVYYYIGYIYGLCNRQEKSLEFLSKAAEEEPDYVFPFRTETESVLRWALEKNPEDWKAAYYLGNYLTANMRWNEGLKRYEQAASFAPSFSVLYRNMGEIYRVRLQDYDRAEMLYKKAVSLSPEDYRLYVVLDETYAVHNKQQARAQLYAEAPEKVRNNFNVVLQRALYFIDTQRFDEALSLLEEHVFHPWEGWTGAREVYVLALLHRAWQKMSRELYGEAVKDLEKAMEYPENLGTGRPADPVFSREYYLIGLCYERLEERDNAEENYLKSLSFTTGGISEQAFFKARAMKKLGKTEEADRLFEDMKKKAERKLGLLWRGRSVYLLRAALAYAGLGESEKARDLLARAYQENPSNRWVRLYASII